MEGYSSIGYTRGSVPWPVFESSLWLRASLIGGSIAAGSVVLVATGETQPAKALIFGVAGALVAWFSARRSCNVLDRHERHGIARAVAFAEPAVHGTPAWTNG